MKKKNDSSRSNAKVAVVFFAFLAIIVGISLIFRLISIVRASQFDGSNRFTFSITNDKNTEVMSVNPGSKDIVIFKFAKPVSRLDAERTLRIPIDAFVNQNALNLDRKINAIFTSMVLGYSGLKTNLTILDLLKLKILAGNIPESSIGIEEVGDKAGSEPDSIVGNLVNDPLIEKENQTIQIINSTDTTGLGGSLAKMVTNMGGNVILVMSEDKSQKTSVITYIDKITYTVTKLQKVLGYKVIKEPENAMADVTIIIGDDKIGTNPF
jgi:hypothetical protein